MFRERAVVSQERLPQKLHFLLHWLLELIVLPRRTDHFWPPVIYSKRTQDKFHGYS